MTALWMLAGALLIWPTGPGPSRLRGLVDDDAGPGHGLDRWRGRVPVTLLAPTGAGVVALLAAGPLHAVAAGLLTATALDLRRRAGLRRDRLTRLATWERALDDAISALRAGSGPEQALDRAASGAVGDPGVAGLLYEARSHARLGGDVPAVLRTDGGPEALDLAAAWQLATRHGVVLAEVVDGLRADVAARRERAVRVDGSLAGPRATVVILTALPAFGILLGSGFGADPLTVLFTGALGGALCLAGAMFLAAGLAWTDRIVDGAAR